MNASNSTVLSKENAFQLWDTDDNNVIGAYSSERAALRVVRDGVRTYGAEAFQSVAWAASLLRARCV